METFSALLALCEGKTTVDRGIPLTKASDVELDVFFDLRLKTVEQTIEKLVVWDAIALIMTSV